MVLLMLHACQHWLCSLQLLSVFQSTFLSFYNPNKKLLITKRKLENTCNIQILSKFYKPAKTYHFMKATLNLPSADWTYSNPVPNKPWFLRVCNTSFLKTLWKKEKLLIMSNFSFSHIVFYPFRELSAIFIKIQVFLKHCGKRRNCS